ncbi:hypothetical protein [Hymenobacter koreensis]|uniref:Uncharacterized protein n=1 Tax=Hymenobacter koreensis TaxID=1084523 RepID=A0ABP8J0C2_9BACT
MIYTLLATASDLDQWASLLEGKATFPELMRRLIRATSPTLTSLSFPSAEGVQLEGWDGLTAADQPTPFVPAGPVGWELGTDKAQKGKADGDYTTRTRDPLGLVPTDSTFIFCTPRRWGQRKKWSTARGAEQQWRDVRAYDADDLITWLTDAPATHIWLSRLLHKRPAGIQDIESFWLDWAAVTNPPIPAALLLAGRGETRDALHSWLLNPAPTFPLLADTQKEAIALLAAAILALPEAERTAVLARTVVVESPEAWRELTAARQPLLLAPLFRDDEAVASAVRQGHHVFRPLDRTDTLRGAHQPVRLNRQAAAAALQVVGLPDARAELLAGVARRSMAAFRRHRFVQSLHTTAPVWATAANAPVLLAAAFTGAWNENEQQAAADKEVLAGLANQPYEQVRAQLVELAHAPGPPVRLVGTTWYVVDKADVWTLLARFHTPDLLARFTAAALHILGTPLPRYQLPADQQLWANLYGFSAPNSAQLRHEVADTLAFLSAEENTSADLVDMVRHVVRELLSIANQQSHVWSSLARYLPRLAEAAPDELLTGIAAGLRGTPPPILELFEEKKGLLYSSSEHTGLLWALELLAWSPLYLAQATRLLARLTQLDPGGVTSNRPKNSLREIFLPWLPHTTADQAQQMVALDGVIRATPDVGWALSLQLLPVSHTTSFGTHTPAWREWAPAKRPAGISYAVLFAGLEQVSRRVLQLVGTDPARWADLISQLHHLHRPLCSQAIQQLQQLASVSLSEEERLELSTRLRKLISWQRSGKRREADFTADELKQLEKAYNMLLPQTPAKRYGWLFASWPALLSGERYKRSTDEYEVKINAARDAAINTLLTTTSLAEVAQLMHQVEAPQFLGARLGVRTDLTGQQKDELLLQFLGSANAREFHFARGLAIEYRLTHQDPWDWATAEVRRQSATWSPAQQAAWLETLPDNPTTWALAAELGPETERHYWLLATPYGIKTDDCPQAFAAFLQHGRPKAAVHTLHLHPQAAVPTDQLTTALEQVLTSGSESEPALHISPDEWPDMVARLADAPDADHSRVARLEFAFLRTHTGDQPQAKLLYQELTRRPEFFVELLSMYTFSKDRSNPPTAEGEMGANAYLLLRSWNTIPGLDSDGTADAAYLLDWVAKAQAACAAADRAIIGEEAIGQMLSYAPVGTDGIWPHEIVRSVLETGNENIERGLLMGKRNSRGFTWRAAYTGGDQEREIAASYHAAATQLAVDWPLTAATLRHMAEDYVRDARREDEEAALHQDLE